MEFGAIRGPCAGAGASHIRVTNTGKPQQFARRLQRRASDEPTAAISFHDAVFAAQPVARLSPALLTAICTADGPQPAPTPATATAATTASPTDATSSAADQQTAEKSGLGGRRYAVVI